MFCRVLALLLPDDNEDVFTQILDLYGGVADVVVREGDGPGRLQSARHLHTHRRLKGFKQV